MNPTERVMHTFEGKPVDRVPTFCAMLEDRTFNEVLGSRGVSRASFANRAVAVPNEVDAFIRASQLYS